MPEVEGHNRAAVLVGNRAVGFVSLDLEIHRCREW